MDSTSNLDSHDPTNLNSHDRACRASHAAVSYTDRCEGAMKIHTLLAGAWKLLHRSGLAHKESRDSQAFGGAR